MEIYFAVKKYEPGDTSLSERLVCLGMSLLLASINVSMAIICKTHSTSNHEFAAQISCSYIINTFSLISHQFFSSSASFFFQILTCFSSPNSFHLNSSKSSSPYSTSSNSVINYPMYIYIYELQLFYTRNN